MLKTELKTIKTSQLETAYHVFGKPAGWPCILCHGFPYDIHCYEKCVDPLVQAGAYVVVPYLRGYGPTRFLSEKTLRSGEQAVLANDLLELMDALALERAVLQRRQVTGTNIIFIRREGGADWKKTAMNLRVYSGVCGHPNGILRTVSLIAVLLLSTTPILLR